MKVKSQLLYTTSQDRTDSTSAKAAIFSITSPIFELHHKGGFAVSIPADLGDEAQELFQLYEDIEAADAVHEFVTLHNLDEEFRAAILKQACAMVE